MEKFKFLEHTADIKFQAFGKTLEEAFKNSVLAVSEILSKGKKIKPAKIKKILIKGKDNEELLYNLLEEVIYLLDSNNFLVSKAEVDFYKNNKKMKVKFYGDSSKNYKGLESIKAVTYNEMFVKKEGKNWVCQAVLDI